MPKVRKAVIPAAGFGTRFLPQTKAMPKEMLPIIDKPIIQYIVEELVDAGVEDIIMVTNSSKRSVEDHFDSPAEDLLANLRLGGAAKAHYVVQIEAISNMANFIFVRQKGPYGNATPIMNAQHLIGDEPFFYIYPDDLYIASPSRYRQMVAMYEEFQTSVVPCIKIANDREYDSYGVVAGEPVRPGVLKMSTIVEKPGKANAPSDLASNAGYILTPDIFEHIASHLDSLVAGSEFYLQPAIKSMIDSGKAVHAFELQQATYYDTGNKLEYLKTVVDFALRRDDIGQEFKDYLVSVLK